MSKRVGNVVVIAEEPPAICEVCSQMAELRPYGPNGERICFKCAQSTPEMREAVRRKMAEVLFGVKK